MEGPEDLFFLESGAVVMYGSMEQLRELANSSGLVRNDCSIACCSNGGVAHWLEGLYFLPWGLRISALG